MMFFLLCLSLISSALAGPPCGGSQVGFWTNPDGTRGGWVASTAKVQAGAVIAPKAQVCESAQVKAGAAILGEAQISGRATILANAEIAERAKVQGDAKVGGGNTKTRIAGEAVVEGSAIVTGTTKIHSKARVSGKSKVHNAIICQASIIEGFDVIDSDYYCQTEDPEPPHPGEAGMKTLLGIDSDQDGVRDDLEIWINQKFSNTPDQNKENQRMAYKAIAKNNVLQMKFSDNKEKVQDLQREIIGPLNACIKFHELQNKKMDRASIFRRKLKTAQEFEAVLMNTRERFNSYMGLQRYFSGWGSPEGEFNKLEGSSSGCVKK
jgi:hypothetical protein